MAISAKLEQLVWTQAKTSHRCSHRTAAMEEKIEQI